MTDVQNEEFPDSPRQSKLPDLRRSRLTELSSFIRDLHEEPSTEVVASVLEQMSAEAISERATNARVLHALSLGDHDA
jgi:hypothetical protein